MKKTILTVVITASLLLGTSSCYVNKFNVGSGAKSETTVKKWNHYLIYGLAPLEVTDPNELAGGAKDYEVTIKFSFVNVLVSGLTFGIYAPTTTIVRK